MSSFQASATYDGRRDGYAFKTGPEGVGYYKDSGDDGDHELRRQERELELEQEKLDAAEGVAIGRMLGGDGGYEGR